jgi:hypothetical protein
VKYVRVVEQAMGNGNKEVYPSELPLMRRLRRLDTLSLQPHKTQQCLTECPQEASLHQASR